MILCTRCIKNHQVVTRRLNNPASLIAKIRPKKPDWTPAPATRFYKVVYRGSIKIEYDARCGQHPLRRQDKIAASLIELSENDFLIESVLSQ